MMMPPNMMPPHMMGQFGHMSMMPPIAPMPFMGPGGIPMGLPPHLMPPRPMFPTAAMAATTSAAAAHAAAAAASQKPTFPAYR